MTRPADPKSLMARAFPTAEGGTPMMMQFLELRAEAPLDALLFYRMGDFYELFFDDAVRASQALDIALTKRGEHQGEKVPMCGVPVHNAQVYLQRLIKAGFKVAVGEQMEDPAEAKKRGAKSVVRRAITRVVTPGTLTEDDLLDPAPPTGSQRWRGFPPVKQRSPGRMSLMDPSGRQPFAATRSRPSWRR